MKENGEQLLQNFIDERYIKKEKSVFDKMSRVIVKNFNYVYKSKIEKNSSKELINAKEFFDIQQLMMLAVQREYSISSLATYEWLDYPKALFDSGGFYKKTVKSMLMDDIEMRTSCSTSNFSTVLSSSNPTVH